jgi:hypothetical protein
MKIFSEYLLRKDMGIQEGQYMQNRNSRVDVWMEFQEMNNKG